MTSVTIGIDLGSHGLRVAWAGANNRVGEVHDLPAATDRPWISAESSPTTGEIHFVSAKRQQSEAAVQKIVAEFAAARERVRSESGTDVDRAVLTVSSWVGSRDRAALRDAARAAGFAEVHLINDSVAAVLADEGGSGTPRTVIVYSMGYSGFELGLVRMARRQVRVLGHAGAAMPSGAQFDHWILNAWIAKLPQREQRDLILWETLQWERLRSAAEDVKHRLAAGEQVNSHWPPWSGEAVQGNQLELVTPTPDMFQEMVREQIKATLDRAGELLVEADLTARDIDTVMLVGGSTALPAVSAMLCDEFGIAPQTTGPGHLALGAATYGAQLQPTAAGLAHDPEVIDALEDEASVTTLSVPLPAVAEVGSIIEPEGERSSDALATARRLWSDGNPDEARTILIGLIEQAQQLLTEIDTAAKASVNTVNAVTPVAGITSPTVPEVTAEARARAGRAIDRARRWLAKGRLAEAVSSSHRAEGWAPGDQDIFDQMIEMHLAAAMAAAGPSRYEEARHWLGCARQHARFNEKVRAYLVERTYEQARHYRDRGLTEDALRLVDECLALNPVHGGARELRAEIVMDRGL